MMGKSCSKEAMERGGRIKKQRNKVFMRDTRERERDLFVGF